MLNDATLSREEKIALLKQWEYDARELEVAEEENMGGGAADMLERILRALEKLTPGDTHKIDAPNKQGGE